MHSNPARTATAVGRNPIPVPEPTLTAAEIVQRARDMVPVLREASAGMENSRRISDEMNQKFQQAGFYRILQPRRFGGYEFDLNTFVAAMIEIARGDGSAGWVLCFNAAHNFFATFLSEAAQIEMYGDSGDLRWPLIYQPTGTITAVEGGYKVDGNWDYASGVQISNWLGAVCLLLEPGAPPRAHMVAMRAEDLGQTDNWFTLGLRGTGSVRVTASDLFVPGHRVLALDDLARRSNVPGYGTVSNPFYRTPDGPVFFLELACVAVGLARAALDFLDDYARSRRQPFPPFTEFHASEKIHRRMAEATSLVDAAEALLYRVSQQQIDRAAAVDDPDGFPEVDIRRAGIDVQQVVDLSFQSIQIVFLSSGSSGARNGSTLERIYRDISMLRTHYVLDYDRTWRNWGALAFGHPAPEAM